MWAIQQTKTKLKQISVIGSGSWATALVKILSESKQVEQIHWWLRKEEYVRFYETYAHNPNYLSSVVFNRNKVKAYTDLEACIAAGEGIVLALPSAFVYDTFNRLSVAALQDKWVVSAVKGMVPGKLQTVSEYIQEHFALPAHRIAVLSGPCHAEEVARERLSYLTLATASEELQMQLQPLFACRYIQIVLSQDRMGIEYAAILKNIYAVASGMANGLGYGDNFKAVLISYALREMQAFMRSMGLPAQHAARSAYLGDLLVTAYSQFSRNRTFGNMLGRGYSVESAQMEMNMIAEGYYAAKQIQVLNRDVQADMPLMQGMYEVIYEKVTPRAAFEEIVRKIN